MSDDLNERLAAALTHANADRIRAFFSSADVLCDRTIESVLASHDTTEESLAGHIVASGVTALMLACETVADKERWDMTIAERAIFDMVALNARELGNQGRDGAARLRQRVRSGIVGLVGIGLRDPRELLNRVKFWTIVSVTRGLFDSPTGAEMGVAAYMMDRFNIEDPAGLGTAPRHTTKPIESRGVREPDEVTVGKERSQQSILALFTEIPARGALLAVRVPFADPRGATEASLTVNLEVEGVERIAASPVEDGVAWWARALEASALGFLGRHGAAVDRGHAGYLAQLGALSVVEAVKGGGIIPRTMEMAFERAGGDQELTEFLRSASVGFEPSLVDVVLTRAYEEAYNLVHYADPGDEKPWQEACFLYTYRFLHFIHSAVFWPRFVHWSDISTFGEVKDRLCAKVGWIGSNSADYLTRLISRTSLLTAQVGYQWGLPDDDPLVQGREFLARFLTAFLYAEEIPDRGNAHVGLVSDDLMRVRLSLAVRPVGN